MKFLRWLKIAFGITKDLQKAGIIRIKELDAIEGVTDKVTEIVKDNLKKSVLLVLCLWASSASAQTTTATNGVQAPGTDAVWVFRSQADNAKAKLLIDAEGIRDGASPFGYAEVGLRAQDEIRDASGTVLSSADLFGGLRLMPKSYGYTLPGGVWRLYAPDGPYEYTGTEDEAVQYRNRLSAAFGGVPISYELLEAATATSRRCVDTRCGDMLELYATGWIRTTAQNAQGMDWIVSNRVMMMLDGQGRFYLPLFSQPMYEPPIGPKRYACIGPDGHLSAQPSPCN